MLTAHKNVSKHRLFAYLQEGAVEIWYRKGTSIQQEPEFLTSGITEKPMKVYYLDEWFNITPPTTPSTTLKVDHISLKGGLNVIDYIVLSAR